MSVLAEVNDDGDRIIVTFDYSAKYVRMIKGEEHGYDGVPGARFLPPPKGGPAWQCPLDLTTARMLRETFKDELELGERLLTWGRAATREEDELRSLATADDAELEVLPKVHPELAKYLRPYQRADALMLSKSNIINANQPGLGKTVETIAAVYERGNMDGSHMIIAPKTSLEVVWQYELEKWTDLPVLVTSGDDSKAERAEIMALIREWHEEGQPFFLVLNPAFVRFQKIKGAEPIMVRGKRVQPTEPVYPELFDINWSTCVFDEYHKMGLSNTKTAMFEAANALQADHKMLLSGTPMGGKPIKLWGALHFLRPESFTSKWRWADQWLVVDDNGYGKVIQGIRQGREDEFWQHLSPYMVRRTKAEVLKELPPKQYIDVWCEMTPRQAKQYKTFAENAEIKIEEENLSATGILAEYTRLKQFADARQHAAEINGKLDVSPTDDSGKLPHILELLSERGITGDDDEEGDEQVVIASQFSQMVDMVHKYLEDKGIKCAKITGAVGQEKRTALVREFQSDTGPRVMVMTTTAGGVSITLDKASTVIILDETWVPDDQEQLEDRVHRGSRIHQVMVYYLRSKGTIEEYIQRVTMGKAATNAEILDLRRQGLRAI